jgi:hypothetical protein
MRNYFNYFTEIEEYFIRRRGKNLLVSPLDWCLIELWKENGIPIHIVLRGIDRSFEAALKRRKKAPTTLFYCHPAVIEAHEEYSQAMVGKADEAAASRPDGQPIDRATELQAVTDHLQTLLDDLSKRTGDLFERVRCRLRAVMEEVRLWGVVDAARLDSELSVLAAFVSRGLLESMDKADLAELTTRVRKDTAVYKKHVSKEMYDRLKTSYLERMAREKHGVPEFSLLDSSGAAGSRSVF